MKILFPPDMFPNINSLNVFSRNTADPIGSLCNLEQERAARLVQHCSLPLHVVEGAKAVQCFK